MATLTLIGEPLPDFEAKAQIAASRCLAESLAETAPRGCSSRLLLARDAEATAINSAKASVEAVPFNAGALPLLWRTGATARPLDGEFMHANTPLAPLRARTEDDGSQTSIVIPHTLAWRAPELMGASHARMFRSFARRSAKLADALLAPTHAVAEQLRDLLSVDVHVLPLAAPAEYLETADSAATRAELNLPARYFATTAQPGENGRLSWILDAMEQHPGLPALVVLYFGSEALLPVRESLQNRVHIVQVDKLSEVGAVLSGAQLLALPQVALGAGYEVLGALGNHLPMLHGSCDQAAELALDASIGADSEAEFAATLARLLGDSGAEELARLRIFAEDRKHSFSWHTTAWLLWELHANM